MELASGSSDFVNSHCQEFSSICARDVATAIEYSAVTAMIDHENDDRGKKI